MKPELSVVIPVYNEESGLTQLFSRLYPALDALNIIYEIMFINDGSCDQSAAILTKQYYLRPDVTRIFLFNNNYGQHMAILAGFQETRGKIIVTLDADLQNPPEEICNLISKIKEGYDYVGSIRRQRQDSIWRTIASKAMNYLREKITHIKITDQGNMLRAYDRNIIDLINRSHETNTFLPALAYTFARKPTEIIVEHEKRAAGESKYSLCSLIRLNFNLITRFSLVPLQFFSILSISLSLVSIVLFIIIIITRFIVGNKVQSIFILFAIICFLIGIILFGMGLLSEYIGRMYLQICIKPRYIIQEILGQPSPDN